MFNLKKLADVQRALVEFSALRGSLKELRGDEKAAAVKRAAENMKRQIEELERMHKEAKNISAKMAEQVQALKAIAEKERAAILEMIRERDQDKVSAQ